MYNDKLVWSLFSYIGVFLGIIYRIPQIHKIYKTKKAKDISISAYTLYSLANLSFIIYLVGANTQEWVLCSYYIIGIILNLIIYSMKKYYDHKSIKYEQNSENDNTNNV